MAQRLSRVTTWTSHQTAMPQDLNLNLFCCIAGTDRPFPVLIPGSETIVDLKKAIRNENPNDLEGIDPVSYPQSLRNHPRIASNPQPSSPTIKPLLPYLTKDHQYHARTKHIDIQYHFIRWVIEEGSIRLVYCPTADVVADTLTKALPSVKVKHFAAEMGLRTA